MKAYVSISRNLHTLAAAGAVLANVLVLGGVLGLFDAASTDAVQAEAMTKAVPVLNAMAERAVPANERG